ncbi:MAG: hypothetical protein HOV79_32170 [Hamadaea sp.]|nr:hypothetical protein [Hamadaea sp.]
MTTPSPQEPAPEQSAPETFSQPPAPPPSWAPPPQYSQQPYPPGPYQQPATAYQQPTAGWQQPSWPAQPAPGAYPPGSHPPAQAGGYPPGWSPVQQAPKKKRTGLIIGVIAGVLLLFCGVAGGFGWWVYQKAQEKAADAAILADAEYEYGNRYDEHRVILTASGSGPVTLTLFNGISEQSVDTSLPWRQTLEVAEDEFTVWIKITARGENGNPQRCTIEVDGTPVVQRGPKDKALTCAVVFAS